jgi:hypothetical protein
MTSWKPSSYGDAISVQLSTAFAQGNVQQRRRKRLYKEAKSFMKLRASRNKWVKGKQRG